VGDIDLHNDSAIILQLMLVAGSVSKKVVDSFCAGDPILKNLWKILNTSQHFFLSHNYSMNGFLDHFETEFADEAELSSMVLGLRDIHRLYVQRGIPIQLGDPFAVMIKQFLDASTAETNNCGLFWMKMKRFQKR